MYQGQEWPPEQVASAHEPEKEEKHHAWDNGERGAREPQRVEAGGRGPGRLRDKVSGGAGGGGDRKCCRIP